MVGTPVGVFAMAPVHELLPPVVVTRPDEPERLVPPPGTLDPPTAPDWFRVVPLVPVGAFPTTPEPIPAPSPELAPPGVLDDEPLELPVDEASAPAARSATTMGALNITVLTPVSTSTGMVETPP